MDIYIYADGCDDNKKQVLQFFDDNYTDGTGTFYIDFVGGDLLKCTALITLTHSAGVMFKHSLPI